MKKIFPIAQAHILQTDGSIGVVMHSDPDDSPIVNQPATFYFDLKDTSSKFNGGNCDCRLVISQGDKTFYDQAVEYKADDDGFAASARYALPAEGNYILSLTGKPKKDQDFKDFKLSYQIQASEGPEGAQVPPQHNHGLHFVLFGIAFLAIFYVIWDEKRKEKSGRTKTGVVN